MKKAKKVVALALCAVMLVVGSVAGTMAYLTSQDTVRNTFTVGNVAIILDEKDTDGSKTNVTTAGRDRANAYKLMPGLTVEKDPTVTVLQGSEKAYVRMLVTIDKQEALDKIFAPNGLPLNEFFGDLDSAWSIVGNGVENSDDTRTYEFRYNGIVDASKAEQKLVPLFKTITVPGSVTNEQLSSIEGMSINVVAHAIQADGFDGDVDKAWKAFDGETE